MSEFDPTKIPFNTLNDVSQAIGGARERMPVGVDFIDAMVNAARRQFVPDALQGTGPYKAIVLRVEPATGKQEPGNFLSNTFGSFFGDPPPIVRIKARIPEIHAALPVPKQLGTAAGDHQQIIDLYPTFVAQDTAIEEPKPGDIVNVDFGNKNTYSDPIYLGPLLKPPAGGGAAGGVGGAGVFGNCTGGDSVGVSAPPGDPLPGTNEAKEPLSFIPLAPRTGIDLEKENEVLTGERGGLANIKIDWEKALKGQGAETASNFPGLGLLATEEVSSELFKHTAVTGKTWIGNIEANGYTDPGKLLGEARDTIIFTPYSTDLSFTNTRLEIIFLFHDYGGFTFEMLNSVASNLNNLTMIKKSVEGTDTYFDFVRNYMLVIPELPWSVYTDYVTKDNKRTNIEINYDNFVNETLAKISEIYGVDAVANQDKIYTSVISVGAGMNVIANSIENVTFGIDAPRPNKMVFAPSPNFSDDMFNNLLDKLKPAEVGGLPPIPSVEEEQKIIDNVLGNGEYEEVNKITTYTFLGYDGNYSTNFDKVVTKVTAKLAADVMTRFVLFEKIKENLDQDSYTARALVSDLEPKVLVEADADLWSVNTDPQSDTSAEEADNSGISVTEQAEIEKNSFTSPTNGGPQEPPSPEPATSPSGAPKGSSVTGEATPPEGFTQEEPIASEGGLNLSISPDDFFTENTGIEQATPGDFETLPLDKITSAIRKAAENRVRVNDFGTIPKSSPVLRDMKYPEQATKNGVKLHVLALNRFEALQKAALDEAGIDFGITSGWRASGPDRWKGGYEGTTPDTYQGFLAQQYPNESFDSAKKWVAWKSAHSTGLAIDYGRPDPMAAKKSKSSAMYSSPAWDWLRKNSYRFGFFPYSNEPWHWEAKLTFDAWATGQEFTPIFSVRVQDVGSKTATLPQGVTPSSGPAGPNSGVAANSQACITPSGDFSGGAGGAFNPAGGSAGKSYPVIEEPFNGGKSGVIVIGGVEYPFSNMTGHQQFKGKARKLDKTPATFIAIHNSVTSTFAGCVRVLLKKGLGVHFTIDIDGRMYQHADPVSQITYHGSPLNYQSVGIETITMYNWKKTPQSHKDAGFTESDPYWWMSKKTRFSKPPESMVNSSNRLMAMLVAKIPTLSNTFPSKDFNKKPGRLSGTPAGGIVSHRDYVAKADGRYFLMRYIEKVTGQKYLPDAGVPAFAAEAEAEADLVEATDSIEDLTGIGLF